MYLNLSYLFNFLFVYVPYFFPTQRQGKIYGKLGNSTSNCDDQ